MAVGAHTVGEMASAGTRSADYNRVISGDCAANGTVRLALDEKKTCTITNTRRVARTVCLDECQNKLDACLDVSGPGGPTRAQCVQVFTRCQRACG